MTHRVRLMTKQSRHSDFISDSPGLKPLTFYLSLTAAAAQVNVLKTKMVVRTFSTVGQRTESLEFSPY